MPPSDTKKKGSAKKGGGGKVKGGLQMPSIAGVEDAAEVEAAKATGYYTGPLPPASVYRVRLKQMFIKNNKNDDMRFTWVAEIDEEHAARKKYNGYGFVNGENYTEQSMRYINAMLDALGLDRKQFHNGGIKVDDPKIDLSVDGAAGKMIIEAVGKQSLEESAGITFYIATKKQKAYGSTDGEMELAFQFYMSEDDWERALASREEPDDEDDDSEDIEVEDEEDTEDEDPDDEDDDEDDEEEDDEDEDDEEEDDEDEDDEEEEDDEEDLNDLSEKDLKSRVVADTRFTDIGKTADLKGVKKPDLIKMLENGPEKPKGKKADKGKSDDKKSGKAKRGGKAPF